MRPFKLSSYQDSGLVECFKLVKKKIKGVYPKEDGGSESLECGWALAVGKPGCEPPAGPGCHHPISAGHRCQLQALHRGSAGVLCFLSPQGRRGPPHTYGVCTPAHPAMFRGPVVSSAAGNSIGNKS